MGIVIYKGKQLLHQAFIGKGRKSQMPAAMSNLPEGKRRWCFLWMWRELSVVERGQTYTKERKHSTFKILSKSFFIPISISAQGLHFSGDELHALACKTWWQNTLKMCFVFVECVNTFFGEFYLPFIWFVGRILLQPLLTYFWSFLLS